MLTSSSSSILGTFVRESEYMTFRSQSLSRHQHSRPPLLVGFREFHHEEHAGCLTNRNV